MQDIYSAEQIRIPPELPEILKNYAKFIIKNHPSDIYQASFEYFQNLASQGKVKDGKLTDAQLSRFYRKFNLQSLQVKREQIEEACILAQISDSQLRDTLALGNWETDSIPWISFFSFLVASAAGSLKATILKIIMVVQVDGSLPVSLLEKAYAFLTLQDKSVKEITDLKMKELFESKEGYLYSYYRSTLMADEAVQKVEDYFNLAQEGPSEVMDENVGDEPAPVDEEMKAVDDATPMTATDTEDIKVADEVEEIQEIEKSNNIQPAEIINEMDQVNPADNVDIATEEPVINSRPEIESEAQEKTISIQDTDIDIAQADQSVQDIEMDPVSVQETSNQEDIVSNSAQMDLTGNSGQEEESQS